MFFSDVHKVRKVGEILGLDAVELSSLLARWAPAAGTPIVLSESMTPVEPLCSSFRELGLDRRSVKTMRAYAYTVVMLLRFLLARGADLVSATEADLQGFRRWGSRRAGPGAGGRQGARRVGGPAGHERRSSGGATWWQLRR